MRSSQNFGSTFHLLPSASASAFCFRPVQGLPHNLRDVTPSGTHRLRTVYALRDISNPRVLSKHGPELAIFPGLGSAKGFGCRARSCKATGMVPRPYPRPFISSYPFRTVAHIRFSDIQPSFAFIVVSTRLRITTIHPAFTVVPSTRVHILRPLPHHRLCSHSHTFRPAPFQCPGAPAPAACVSDAERAHTGRLGRLCPYAQFTACARGCG